MRGYEYDRDSLDVEISRMRERIKKDYSIHQVDSNVVINRSPRDEERNRILYENARRRRERGGSSE